MSYLTNSKIKRYLNLAEVIASWSKDSTKIGAVAVGDMGQILSQGYNGMPRNFHDNYSIQREEKLLYSVHAEQNCIYNACLNGVSLHGSSLFVYGLPPCAECSKGIIQVGIKEVHYLVPEHLAHREGDWKKSTKYGNLMMVSCGISVKEH